MTDTKQLNALIARMEKLGATVTVKWDAEAAKEGREVHDSISVKFAGFGTHPMSPIYASERFTRYLADNT